MPSESLPQALRRINVFDLPDGKTVIANHNSAKQANITLRRARALILQCVLAQPLILRLLSAVECVNWMVAPEFFD